MCSGAGLLYTRVVMLSSFLSLSSSSRSLKSRHPQQHSVSCSESLLLSTPRKLQGQSLLNSSLHSVASDASLLSSLLDESSVQETTLVDTFWGTTPPLFPPSLTLLSDLIILYFLLPYIHLTASTLNPRFQTFWCVTDRVCGWASCLRCV